MKNIILVTIFCFFVTSFYGCRETDEGSNPEPSTPVTANEEEMKIYQIVPNPFSERTVVQCYIPQTVKEAELTIYDVTGKPKLSLPVTERGAVDIPIEAEQLSAQGMYYCTLTGDEKTSNTLKMVLRWKVGDEE